MTIKTDGALVGLLAKYVGPEDGMRVTGRIFAVDERYIWIRDNDGRERGCFPVHVDLLPVSQS